MLNNTTITGYLRKKSPIRRNDNGIACLEFLLSSSRDFKVDGKKVEDLIPCVVWNKNAEYLDARYQKGALVQVQGRMEMRDWADSSISSHRCMGVNAAHVYIYETKYTRRNREPHSAAAAQETAESAENADDEQFEPEETHQ